MDVSDSFKPYDQILLPDQRNHHQAVSLEVLHEELSLIQIHDGVPKDVRQLFETAKNVALYSWFVYRFHQVAELAAHSAMEMALRMRFQVESPEKKPPMLKGLLRVAQNQGWITNEGFPSLRRRAERNANYKKEIEAIELMKEHDLNEIEVEEVTLEEIEEALSEIDMVSSVVNYAADLRNDLAHGSSSLSPTSLLVLRTNAEVINQLFK